MLQVTLTPKLGHALASIAARTGALPSDLARAALVRYLDDVEDYAVAVEGWRINDPAQNKSSTEVLRELGIND